MDTLDYRTSRVWSAGQVPFDRERPNRGPLLIRSLRADYTDLPQADRRFFGRVESAAWLGAALFILVNTAVDIGTELLLLGAVQQTLWRVGLAAALSIAMVLVLNRVLLTLASRVVRERESARAEREHAARVQGVLLAAGTMQHHLNNQLALTVGYSELLARDPRLPADLRARAEEALQGAEAAAATLANLWRVTDPKVTTDLGGPPILDLETEGPNRGL